LLESTELIDVFLDGFNGIRYLTAGPVVAVTEMQYMGSNAIVLRDASEDPSRDRGGRIVFGQVGRPSGLFCIVGNRRF